MILWAMLYRKVLGPGTLKQTTYLNTVAKKVHPFMATVLPNSSGLQQDNAPNHTAKIVQKWLEKHIRSMEAASCNLNVSILVQDTTEHLQRSCRAHTLTSKSLFCGMRGTYTIF